MHTLLGRGIHTCMACLFCCSDAKVRLMRCNSRTINRPTRCFTVCTDRTDRQIVSPLTKFNEMQFTDCQHTDSLFYNTYRQINAYNYRTVNGSTTTFSVWQTIQIVWSIWQTVSVRLYWTWVQWSPYFSTFSMLNETKLIVLRFWLVWWNRIVWSFHANNLF